MGQTHPSFTEAASPTTTFPTNFKLFVQKDGESIHDVCRRVEAFVAEAPRKAKSIGIEFLESRNVNVITLGYEIVNGATPIALDFRKIGNIEAALTPSDADSDDIAGIEHQMGQFSATFKSAICHEVSVDGSGDLYMLVMAEKPAVLMTEATAE